MKDFLFKVVYDDKFNTGEINGLNVVYIVVAPHWLFKWKNYGVLQKTAL